MKKEKYVRVSMVEDGKETVYWITSGTSKQIEKLYDILNRTIKNQEIWKKNR